MRLFGGSRKHTKKSCLGNAIVAVLLGVLMISCIFMGAPKTSEEIQGFIISAGIMFVIAAWWIYRYIKFDEKDFDDPFHFGE